MSEISQNIHENNGIDHNLNIVLSILNIKKSINANFSPGYSLVWSNIAKELFLYETKNLLSQNVIFHKK